MTAREITRAHGGDWYGTYGLVPGPGHSDDDRSLKVYDLNADSTGRRRRLGRPEGYWSVTPPAVAVIEPEVLAADLPVIINEAVDRLGGPPVQEALR